MTTCRIHILIILAAALFMTACQNDSEPSMQNGAALVINASIRNCGTSVTANTRAVLTKAVFGKDETMGLCICKNDTSTTPTLFEEHQPGYGNIKATSTTASGDAWNFNNSKITSTLSALYLTSRKDHVTADVYAYSPYDKNLTDPRAWQIDFTNQTDWMVANENGSNNRDLNPEQDTLIHVELTFNHIMSRIRVGFKLENSGSNHKLDSILVKKSGDKDTPLYSGGTFNIMTKTATSYVVADSVGMAYKNNNIYIDNETVYTYYEFLLFPTELVSDNSLTLVFSIDGFRHEYPIKISDILHDDGSTNGFKPGYTYEFRFQLDNYVHLKGINVNTDWIDATLIDSI